MLVVAVALIIRHKNLLNDSRALLNKSRALLNHSLLGALQGAHICFGHLERRSSDASYTGTLMRKLLIAGGYNLIAVGYYLIAVGY